MTKLNIHEAKTHLSKYLERVREGEKILLCKNGVPIAQITPLSKEVFRHPQFFGLARGRGSIPKSFFEDLTEEEMPGAGLQDQ